jgi:hypothetical protein
MIQNENGKYFYTANNCNGSSVNNLIVPNVSYSGYDKSGYTCGITPDSSVSYW